MTQYKNHFLRNYMFLFQSRIEMLKKLNQLTYNRKRYSESGRYSNGMEAKK